MLVWLSPRRLVLLSGALFIVAILTLRRTTYDEYLPVSGIPTVFRISRHDTKATRWTYARTQDKIQELRTHWTPPTSGSHYPPYNEYGERDYDPNLWESFEWDHDFYINNGVHRLVKEESHAARPAPYLPYTDYNTPTWKHEWHGEYTPCEGARGRLLNESEDDWVMAYSRTPPNFPKPVVGDASILGLDIDRCFDRFNRLGPYGHGQNKQGVDQDWNRSRRAVNWTEVQWGRLQDKCIASNQDRYRPDARGRVNVDYGVNATDAEQSFRNDPSPVGQPKHHHRTAVLVRTWSGYDYTDNDLQNLRSLITELSLFSGGEYQVFLFVNVKDRQLDLNDLNIRQIFLDKYVPHEFHSISILWNERILEQWYPLVGDWQVYWHQFMPLQWFSSLFPHFDFVWNWEVDVRYTGNHYHLLEQVAAFARSTPRKYLWEKNQRFYIPGAHGTYQQWTADTHAAIESAMVAGSTEPVWGPRPYDAAVQKPIGPVPPRGIEADHYEWGVDEEADLISLQPIWNPNNTDWSFKDKIFNFVPDIRPHFSAQDPLDNNFSHPEFANIPRRVFVNTMSRLSKRQLHAMHLENRAGRTMQAEMWPATVALHHGLKAVYAPHPIWTDRKWPAWYLDAVFNANDEKHASWSEERDSVYNHDREHNFAGWSWYYNADFPRVLYRRWLGWQTQVDPGIQSSNNPLQNLGGHDFEERGVNVEFRDDMSSSLGLGHGESHKVKIGGNGPLCLPPMLLHPVKAVSEPG